MFSYPPIAYQSALYYSYHVQIRVTIEDVNDTPPIFDDFSTIVFSEDTLPGEVITNIKAYDGDQGSVVEYSIVRGDRNTFSIH